MSAQGNGSQLAANSQFPSGESVAPSPGISQEVQETAGPQPAANLPMVKTEVDDYLDVDTKNMANAPFVNKVWRIVNDPANFKYIRWVPGGKSIQIVDREGFEKQLLPYYFKHKRFTSFVRQLNMYGWHKVQDLSAGTMQSSEEHWQFANPNFVQGHPELLRRIVRNKGHKPGQSNGENIREANPGSAPTPGTGGEAASGNTGAEEGDRHDLKAILRELEQIKSRQIHIGEDLGRMRKDNELLWSEYYQTRERYDKHSQMLSRILRFLATVYGNQSKILDLNNPNSPASAAAERVLRGPIDPHHQQYLGLLPASDFDRIGPAESIQSSIHDLREIEQMQHQIDETNTPSSRSSKSPSSKSPSLSSAESIGTHDDISDLQTSRPTPQSRNTQPYIPTAPNVQSVPGSGPQTTKPDLNRALVPSRRTSQAIAAPPTPNSARMAQLRNNVNTNANIPLNNQLVRASNSRFGSPMMQMPQDTTGYPTAQNQNQQLLQPQPQPQGMPQQNYQQHPSPQLQEVPDDYDDPDRLFPELNELSPSANLPAHNNQDLEQISKELVSNGNSLQQIQEWLYRRNPDNFLDEDQFNVDDFLSTDEGANNLGGDDIANAQEPTSPKTAPSDTNNTNTNANSNNGANSAEPDRKRVRVN